MGWSSGSSLFAEVIEVLQEHIVSDEVRLDLYRGLIEVFEDRDCDTLDECLGEDDSFDKAFNEAHPGFGGDDDDEEEEDE